jgi:choline-sulfatase
MRGLARWRGAAAVAAALLGLAGCARDAEAPAAPAGGPERFVLVTIDTLRADHVGSYGAGGTVTPILDGLAARGVRFETAIAPTPLTLPSHTTLLTAIDPPEHRVRGNGGFQLPARVPTLAERMKEGGYATAAFVSAFVLDRRFGLARGFDRYDDHVGVQALEAGVASRTADRTVDAALAWLAEAPERFFLWLHLYDPHAPYEAPEAYQARKLGQPYDAEIAFADAQLGRLLAAIETRLPSGTVVLVTSDHGESLGEHGEPTHAFTVYDATQRVPLLLAGPGLPAGSVVPALVRLADVAPTLLELAGLPPLAATTGTSLLPLVRGEPEAAPRVAWVETLATQLDFGWSPLLGVRTQSHKYVRAPRPELYEIASDPGETRNVAAEEPALVRELDALVEARAKSEPTPAPRVEPEVAEQLRALGYVAGSGVEVGGRPLGEVGGLDPKDEIARGTLTAIQEAFDLMLAGRPAEALARLEPLESVGLEVELMRSEAALLSGALDRARAGAERGLELGPGHAPAFVMLGRVAEAEGRIADAAVAYRDALERDPKASEAWTGLGRVAEALGDVETARTSYQRASGLARVDSESLWRLAALELETGRAEEARAALAALPQRIAGEPDAAAHLALAERDASRLDLAAVRLKGALRRHPDAAALLLAQAEVLEDQGRDPAALAVRRKAHAASPNDPAARIALARSLALAAVELDEALALAEAAVAQTPTADAREALALVRAARGEFDAALAAADQALATAPPPARARLLFRRAEALAGLGRTEAATEDLAEARRLARDGPRAKASAARVERLLTGQRG